MPTAALPPMPKLCTDVAPVTPSVPPTVALPEAAEATWRSLPPVEVWDAEAVDGRDDDFSSLFGGCHHSSSIFSSLALARGGSGGFSSFLTRVLSSSIAWYIVQSIPARIRKVTIFRNRWSPSGS